MVDISGKIAQIKQLIDKGIYLTINRGRQFGKTTTLDMIERIMAEEYQVINISFGGVGSAVFESEEGFCGMFTDLAGDATHSKQWINKSVRTFDSLSRYITDMCKDRKTLLMTDSVSSVIHYEIFLEFLNMLKDKYTREELTFNSVILAGIFNTRYIRNSNLPWIELDSNVDMSFSSEEISGMLSEYEQQHRTGMNINQISDEIYEYTGGYPFFVSGMCRYIDEKLNRDWTHEGVQKAFQAMLADNNTLFAEIFQEVNYEEDLRNLLFDVVYAGKSVPFSIENININVGYMLGFLKNDGGEVRVTNKIYEQRFHNYFTLLKLYSK
jgi:hypothetical protein